MLAHPAQVVAVVREAEAIIFPVRLETDLLQHLPGTIHQHRRRFVHRHLPQQECLAGEGQQEQHAGGDARHQAPGDGGPQPAGARLRPRRFPATAARRRPARPRADRHRAATLRPPGPTPGDSPVRARDSAGWRARWPDRCPREPWMGWRLQIPRAGAALEQRAAGEGPPAGEQLVEHDAQRVDVALHRGLAAQQLFRRHVRGRAGAARSARAGLGQYRQTEIGDAHLALGVEDDVGGLQIAVHDPALVRGGDAGANLPAHIERLVLGQPADTPRAATTGRRRPPAPWTCTAGRRSRRRRRHGKHSGGRPDAPGALQRRSAPGGRGWRPDRAAGTSAPPPGRAPGRRRGRHLPCRPGPAGR